MSQPAQCLIFIEMWVDLHVARYQCSQDSPRSPVLFAEGTSGEPPRILRMPDSRSKATPRKTKRGPPIMHVRGTSNRTKQHTSRCNGAADPDASPSPVCQRCYRSVAPPPSARLASPSNRCPFEEIRVPQAGACLEYTSMEFSDMGPRFRFIGLQIRGPGPDPLAPPPPDQPPLARQSRPRREPSAAAPLARPGLPGDPPPRATGRSKGGSL